MAPRWSDKQLLFVTGKGGIGKTLIAAALGQNAAESGKRTLLVESSSIDQMAPLFGVPPVGHDETLVAPRLACINLDPPETFREYVVKYLGLKTLYDNVFSNRVVASFINTVPGLAEVMLLGRLFYTCELAASPRPDLVVFDGFASGHFLSLMTTPDAVLATELGGPLVRETQRIRDFLSDRARCGVIYVVTPEDLVVSECLDFLPRLHRASPAAVVAVVVNRTPLPRAPATAEGSVAGSYLHRRREASEGALRALESGIAQLRAGGMNLDLLYLPDVGFVSEPLPEGFGAALWRRAVSNWQEVR